MRASFASMLFGVTCVLAGCDKTVEYHRDALPGFSLDLPKQVSYRGDPKAQYRTGQVQAQFGLSIVSVSWQVGAIATAEELPGLAKAIAAALPDSAKMSSKLARSEMVNGHKATWLDAKIAMIDLTFVDIECGRRSVMIAVGAAKGFEAMRSRILRSFTCTPDEAAEKAIASSVPIGVDDPKLLATWFSIPNDDAFTLSNGELVAVFAEVPHTSIDGRTLDKVLPSLFATYGGDWTASHRARRPALGGEREIHFGTMSMEGEKMQTALTLWPCGSRGDMVMGMVMRVEGTDLEPAAEFLAKVRCSQAGDPPLPLAPTPPEMSDPGADGE